jgi:hypothetical protein
MEHEDYQDSIDEFVSSLSVIERITQIYVAGTVTAPGLSDLDFICVVDDSWTKEDTLLYYTQRESHSSRLKKMIGHGTVLIVPESLSKDMLLMDDFGLENIYSNSKTNVSPIRYKTEYDKVMRVLDWLPERVVSTLLCAAGDNVDEMKIHCLIKSTLVSFKKTADILENKDNTEDFENLNHKLKQLRSIWFNLTKSKKLEMLYSYIEDMAGFAVKTLGLFARYLEERSILFLEKGIEGTIAFKCFKLSKLNQFVVGGKVISIDIPDVYFLNYFIQATFKTELSSRIGKSLVFTHKLTEKDFFIDSQLNKKILERNIFVDQNMKFLMTNGFKDGLLKYGMFI